jgi:tripartite-type tricarboxylate transporter receptor subunit TctC
MFGVVPNVLTISPEKRIKTVRALVDRGKQGGLTYASAGVGSATHWAAERFLLAAGFRATHVPFRGGPDALTEVMTGCVDFCLLGISSSIAFIKNGQLMPLAVSTRRRTPALPDVPTTTEAGYPESDYSFWNGLLAPAKTPRAIVQRLHDEIAEVLKSPAVQAKFAPQGVDPLPLKPEEFDAMITKEIKSNVKLAQAAGLKFN